MHAQSNFKIRSVPVSIWLKGVWVFLFSFLFFLIYVYTRILPVYMSVYHMHYWCPQELGVSQKKISVLLNWS